MKEKIIREICEEYRKDKKEWSVGFIAEKTISKTAKQIFEDIFAGKFWTKEELKEYFKLKWLK